MSKILIVGSAGEGVGWHVADQLERHMSFSAIEQFRPNYITQNPDDVYEELDVADEASIRKYLQDNGPFDYLVYAAGTNSPRYHYEDHMAAMIYDMKVNAFGFAEIHAEHARQFGQNRILSSVAIVSDAARIPMRGSTSYCASKAALSQIIKVMARESMPHARVNGVAPTSIEGTRMSKAAGAEFAEMRGFTPEYAASYELAGLPMGRKVRPEEVAEVVISTLFGPEYMNGAIVDITGGK